MKTDMAGGAAVIAAMSALAACGPPCGSSAWGAAENMPAGAACARGT